MVHSATRDEIGNLPHQLTSFVGRRREIGEAKQLLSSARMVTLTGVGGVGKTRLALRVAADIRSAFEDGVWFVELGKIDDAELLTDTIAMALGVREQTRLARTELLIDYLAPRQLLLILDNCEHLVAAVASLADVLLRHCSELRILATSRELIGMAGEEVLRVPALSIPEPGRAIPAEGLSQYDGVTLFAERAAVASPIFSLTEANHRAVEQICRRLDGLPLAIELAVAGLRVMSVDQLLERLTDRYRFVAVASRGVPTRQQTLRACIDWSHELCSQEEQELWGRLTVFAGSFELDAVEGICSGPTGSRDVLDLVAALIDKSILLREERGTRVRYRMLETIRDYGREKVRTTGEYFALRRRHSDWYERMVLLADAQWISPRQAEWIDRVEIELPNLREAMEFSLADSGDVDIALRMATSLYPFWLGRGFFSEGRAWLSRALACHRGPPTVTEVEAVCAESMFAGMQGDIDSARTLAGEGKVLADQLDAAQLSALVTFAEGSLALFAGDYPGAVASVEAALGPLRDRGVLREEIEALASLGLACGMQGDLGKATSCHEQILSLTRTQGESMYRAFSLTNIGLADWYQGNTEEAAELLLQGLQLARTVNDSLTSSWCLEALAWIAGSKGDAERTALLMGAARSLGQTPGSPTSVIPILRQFHEKYSVQARDSLGDGEFTIRFRNGTRMTFDEAIAYALGKNVGARAPTDDASRLTRRERQVADLVAQGLTDKVIADRLVISQRTAQGHVEHVLSKLGFSSRAQIAAWAVERDRSS